MTDRRPLVVVIAVFALALALRLLPLAWSPYPATLDGIAYAGLARDALATGRLPVDLMRADNFVFTAFLSTAGAVLGTPPLRVAQPAVAFVGAASVVVGVAIVRRFGRDLGFDARSVRLASVAVGLGLAVDGLYLRRTGVPDEEALAFLFLPLLIIALHRGLRQGRIAWLAVSGVFLVAFPLTHTFSTLVAGTTLVAWVVAARGRVPARRLVVGGVIAGGFWLYFAGYYAVTARLGLVVPYVGRITSHPGLFLAWLVLMAAGILWFRHAGPRTRRGIVIAPLLAFVGLVLVNAVQPVYPGTVPSQRPLALLVALYIAPVLAAAFAAPRLGADREGAVVLLALFAAPVTVVGFSLTASLTPEFFATVLRAQTFAHLPVVALAALAVAGPIRASGPVSRQLRRPSMGALLLGVLVLTAPVAYIDLDTLAFPSTTTEAEFRGATFAAERVPGTWTSDHVLTRIGVHYYRADPSIGPTAAWLAGGPPPPCAMLSATSWTTHGAHLWPAGPQAVPAAAYDRTIARRNLVYGSRGRYDAFAVSLPPTATPGC